MRGTWSALAVVMLLGCGSELSGWPEGVELHLYGMGVYPDGMGESYGFEEIRTFDRQSATLVVAVEHTCVTQGIAIDPLGRLYGLGYTPVSVIESLLRLHDGQLGVDCAVPVATLSRDGIVGRSALTLAPPGAFGPEGEFAALKWDDGELMHIDWRTGAVTSFGFLQAAPGAQFSPLAFVEQDGRHFAYTIAAGCTAGSGAPPYELARLDIGALAASDGTLPVECLGAIDQSAECSSPAPAYWLEPTLVGHDGVLYGVAQDPETDRVQLTQFDAQDASACVIGELDAPDFDVARAMAGPPIVVD